MELSTTSEPITSQPPTSRKGTGPSWFQIWAVVIGTAVMAGLVVLAVTLWHGQSSATPATTSTPTSTSAPAQPAANPAVPSRPGGGGSGGAGRVDLPGWLERHHVG